MVGFISEFQLSRGYHEPIGRRELFQVCIPFVLKLIGLSNLSVHMQISMQKCVWREEGEKLVAPSWALSQFSLFVMCSTALAFWLWRILKWILALEHVLITENWIPLCFLNPHSYASNVPMCIRKICCHCTYVPHAHTPEFLHTFLKSANYLSRHLYNLKTTNEQMN